MVLSTVCWPRVHEPCITLTLRVAISYRTDERTAGAARDRAPSGMPVVNMLLLDRTVYGMADIDQMIQ